MEIELPEGLDLGAMNTEGAGAETSEAPSEQQQQHQPAASADPVQDAPGAAPLHVPGMPAGQAPQTLEEANRVIGGLFGEIQRARLKSRERDARFDELETQYRQLTERLGAEAQAAQQVAEQERAQQAPNREEDPIGYLEWVVREQSRQHAQQLAEVQGQYQQMLKAGQQATAQNQVQTYLVSVGQAHRAARQTPGYSEAVQHLLQSRTSTLLAGGYPPEQVQKLVEAEMAAAVERGMAGNNLAATMIGMARGSGWQPSQQQGQPNQQPALQQQPQSQQQPAFQQQPQQNQQPAFQPPQQGGNLWNGQQQRQPAPPRNELQAGAPFPVIGQSPTPPGTDLANAPWEGSDDDFISFTDNLPQGQSPEQAIFGMLAQAGF